VCQVLRRMGWPAVRHRPRVKTMALDRLIANGFVEQANGHSITKYQHTAKTELLFTQLCVGISGG
jgi:hypothetical protein